MRACRIDRSGADFVLRLLAHNRYDLYVTLTRLCRIAILKTLKVDRYSELTVESGE